MTKLPTVVTSSVIRSSQQGESHGGVYLVDLERRSYRQVIDWNDPSISWEGRGWDRGLRGIAFHSGHVYLAASDEIFVYTPDFQLVKSYRNPFLKHCHEICVQGGSLYLTSTGFDSILEFDLRHERFVKGFYLDRRNASQPQLRIFDPSSTEGPVSSMECHINNVIWVDGSLYVSGTKMNTLWALKGLQLEAYATIPFTTHNASPFRDGVLCQDTGSDQVAYLDRNGKVIEAFPLVRYPLQSLTWTQLTADRARQAFGRGLCVTDDQHIIAGSSPSTITVYKFGNAQPIASVQLSNDIRNAIHGLEIWPF
jgi:hypothetical protein